MKYVFISSEFGGLEENYNLACLYCRYALDYEGEVSVFAPHVFYSRFWSDDVPELRKRALALGLHYLEHMADELWVFVRHAKISSGMRKEIKKAIELGTPVHYFDATDGSKIVPLSHIDPLFASIPPAGDLMSPEHFAPEVKELFDKLADDLGKGVLYDDVQKTLDSLLGSESVQDEEANAAWEEDYRNG